MILIDSLYINNSGGKMLLDYLIFEIEKSETSAFYLFDSRCSDDYKWIEKSRKVYMKATLYNRHQFYLKNKLRFTKVFCFGNLAPTIKLSVPVFTYFHQRIFLEIPKSYGLKERLIFKLKRKVFKYLLKNTDLLLLQTENIKDDFIKSNKNFDENNIIILPFYEQIIIQEINKVKDRFIYVSNGVSHKNHFRLLDAFVKVYDDLKKGELILTVAEDFPEVFSRIQELANLGYPIINIGFLSKAALSEQYAKAEFLIFPSTSESLGLGILEALEAGCKVLGADLPYMHTICNPSLTFNPYSVNDIQDTIAEALTKPVGKSKQKVFNQIDQLIQLLRE